MAATDDENSTELDDSNDSSDKLCNDYFIDLLERFGKPLISKSHLSNDVKEKNGALTLISLQIRAEKGIDVTAAQIRRKFYNFKSRTKKKADVNRTGNKRIDLSKAEERLWTLLLGDSNPALSKLPCKFGLI